MKIFRLGLFISLILISNEKAFSFNHTINVSIIQKKDTSVVKGVIYFEPSGKILYVIDSPVKQIIKISNKKTYIYYPEKNEVFQYPVLDINQQLPFFQLFLDVQSPDLGLKSLQFDLKKIEQIGDTTYSYWKNNKIKNLEIKLKKTENLLISESCLKGVLVKKVLVKDIYYYKGQKFPKSIITSQLKNKKWISETILWGIPELDTPFPRELYKSIPNNSCKIYDLEF